jgi:hypothetical protein
MAGHLNVRQFFGGKLPPLGVSASGEFAQFCFIFKFFFSKLVKIWVFRNFRKWRVVVPCANLMGSCHRQVSPLQ